ncbi:hypothetical protein GGR57DRAFT_518807 [Xylariaceae sp. FL1272]|nr:hypothetical protein GGR57DRAFT_518807 [Xylariaceae sp. FL1272]
MQLFNSLALFTLLSAPSLGNPIKTLRGYTIADFAKLNVRANPPPTYTTVNIASVDHEVSGNTLFTNGLATCIAVVLRNTTPGASGAYDKVLAHVSSSLCGSDTTPSLDQQLDNMWQLYDQSPFPVPEALVIYPGGASGAQQAFNEYVYNSVAQQARMRGMGTAASIPRDQSQINAPGGSRLWIDGTQTIYWSVFDEPIA